MEQRSENTYNHKEHVVSLESKDHLKSYIRRAVSNPMLSHAEEIQLVKQWKENQDKDAMEKITTSHLKLVVKIAYGYRGYGMDISELISEGSIGVMQALNKFDHTKGVRFSTYAMWWIKAQLKDFVMKNWSMVKIGTTGSQKKLFFSLRAWREKLIEQGERYLSPEHKQIIAKELQVSIDDINDMEKRLMQDSSLNASISSDEDGEWIDFLSSEVDVHDITIAHQQELDKRRALLINALNSLPAKEKEVIIGRRLTEPPKKLEEIAQSINLSKERVRQIEVNAFEKLQLKMHTQARNLKM
jgi:RNA polymerase sigma-32 factor